MTAAEKCLKNGWKVGTRLSGREDDDITTIEITAIGREQVLAVAISVTPGEWWEGGGREESWDLDFRRWRKVSTGKEPKA